jgi:hypothetical protein
MAIGKTIGVYFKNHMKDKNSLCGKNSVSNITAVLLYNYN